MDISAVEMTTIDAEPCDKCGADVASHLPHVYLMSTCRHCRKPLAVARRGGLYPMTLDTFNRVSSHIPKVSVCTRCRQPVIVIEPEDEGRIELEIKAVDNLGELEALIAKVVTYDMGRGYCSRRFVDDIQERPAEKYHNVHATHTCGKMFGIFERYKVAGTQLFDKELDF